MPKPNRAEKRRRAKDAQKKAERQPEEKPSEGRTVSRLQRTAGGAALLAAGMSFFAAATLFPTTSADTEPNVQAVAGVQQQSYVFDDSFFLSLDPPAEPAPAELPALVGGELTQSSAQSLGEGLEESVPAPVVPAEPVTNRNIMTGVNITFYDCANQGFCGNMYNGRKVYEGAAACSWNLPIGTRFIIVGDPTHRIYTCEDRGMLSNTWVDIFWYYPSQGHSWQSIVGRYGTIEIVSMP